MRYGPWVLTPSSCIVSLISFFSFPNMMYYFPTVSVLLEEIDDGHLIVVKIWMEILMGKMVKYFRILKVTPLTSTSQSEYK